MPSFLSTRDADFEARFAALLGMKREEAEDVDQRRRSASSPMCARAAIAAVLDLTAKFDRLTLTAETLAFTAAEIEAECAKVSAEDRAALELAADAYPRLPRPPDAAG